MSTKDSTLPHVLAGTAVARRKNDNPKTKKRQYGFRVYAEFAPFVEHGGTQYRMSATGLLGPFAPLD
jgi:hypothetical protein